MHTPAFESNSSPREAAADNDKQFADALSHFDNAILGYFLFRLRRQSRKTRNA